MKIQLICFSRKTIIHTLVSIMLLLLAASLVGQVILHFTEHHRLFGLIYLFNVDEERNIPTYFSSVILLFASLLCAVIVLLESKERYYWLILALGFLLISMDEFIGLHEKLNALVTSVTKTSFTGTLYFAWLIPASLLVLILAILFYGLLMRLDTKMRESLFLAACFFIGGSMIIEALTAPYYEQFIVNAIPLPFIYSVLTTLEEGLEMAGVILFINTLLHYIHSHHPDLSIKLASD
jgi:hypothetical protein